MQLTKGNETINFPCSQWTDSVGNTYPWPQLAFLFKMGFSEVAAAPPTLAERQAFIWEQIKAFRDRKEDGGVLVAGKWWHTDIKSRAKYLGLMLMGAAVAGVQWKTMDGSIQELSQALVAQVFQGVAIADTTNFANAESHRAAMIVASNLQSDDPGYKVPEEYDYSAGWLGSYAA